MKIIKVTVNSSIKSINSMLMSLPDRYHCETKYKDGVGVVEITKKDGTPVDNYDKIVISDKLMPWKVQIAESK